MHWTRAALLHAALFADVLPACWRVLEDWFTGAWAAMLWWWLNPNPKIVGLFWTLEGRAVVRAAPRVDR